MADVSTTTESLWLVGFDERPFQYPPQGLLVTALAARKAGWSAQVSQFGLEEWDAFAQALERRKPSAIGLSLFAGPRLKAVIQASRMATKAGVRVVWGGALATTAPELCAGSGLADVLVIGRSEVAPEQWLTALSNAKPGQDTVVIEGQVCALPGRFDEFYPDPALLEEPRAFTQPRPPFSAVAVVSLSRGCRRKCAFCAAPVVSGGRSRYRPEQILDAVRFWRDHSDADVIEFGDDELLDPKFDVPGLVEKIGHPYYAQLHVRTITEERADWLAATKCQGVKLGAESGSDEVLAKIRKGCRAADIEEATRRLAKRGLLTVLTFIAGLPGEEPEDLAATVELAHRVCSMSPRVLARFAHFTPYPGTHLWRISRDLGFEPPARLADWAGLDTSRVQVPWVPKNEMESLVHRLNERLYFRKVHALARARA